MELNTNINHIKGHSLNDDDDNFSAISRASGFCNSLNSPNNSDSECSGTISVRDMVQRYNKQFQKAQSSQVNYKIKNRYTAHRHHSQHLLAATKSSYCGLNNYGSQINAKQFIDQQIEDDTTMPVNDCQQHKIKYCENCIACVCCQNRSHKNSITTKMLPTSSLSSTSTSTPLLQPNNENNKNTNNYFNIYSDSSTSTNCKKINTKDILEVKNYTISDDTVGSGAQTSNAVEIKLNKKDSIVGLNSQLSVKQKKNIILSTDSVEKANICQQQFKPKQLQEPIETSYQSKTTIAKTSSGVRIIIDIFFDQEQQYANTPTNDIVGSRVETAIPQSRILAEFQQQIMAANNSNKSNNSNATTTNITNTTTAASSAASFYRGVN